MRTTAEKAKNIEDAYPLSPVQEGMLFHSLLDPGSGVYVTQLALLLDDPDVPALERAWQSVVDRHAVLRTAFAWQSTEKALQIVGARVRLPVLHEDWRGLDPAEREERREDFLARDRARGFVVSRAPLMRLAFLRVGERQYELVWSSHHILLDGWSVLLVMREVAEAYLAFREGGEPRWTERRPYKDFIAWLQTRDESSSESYWREELAGMEAPTSLGIERRPSGAGEDGYRSESIRLPASTAAALQSFARKAHVTLNTVVQGAWAILLARYAGTPEVLFGATVSGRSPEVRGIESMIGLFINTLPVRLRVAPEERLSRWLASVQERQSRSREHEHTPLGRIHSWSEVPRNRPFFESIVVFENYPVEGAARIGEALPLRSVRAFDSSHYPLTLVARPDRGLNLRLSYDRRLFDSSSMLRVLGHLETLLRAVAERPDARLGELTMLTERERRAIETENETGTDYPRAITLDRAFAARAEESPEKVAVRFGAERWTYRELDAEADRLARRLRALGIGPETVVAIYLERSAAAVVATLGVVKAGGAYLPLDPAQPASRLRLMLEDAGARAVVTSRALADRAPQCAGPVLRLEDEDESPSPGLEGELESNTTAESLLYVMYTSGSTGKPKGVAVTHRAVSRLVCDTNYVAFEPSDRVGFASNIAFDAATFEIWGALLHGARLVGLTRETALSPDRLAAWIRDEGITVLFLTTALFNQLAAEDPRMFSSLRWLLFGGEAVDPGSVRRVLEAGAPERLVHVYGPTESTTFATWHLVQDVPEDARTVPIGIPISNTRAYVADPWMDLLPAGAVGELVLGGDGLARGYLGDPALTAERFVPDPFGRGPGDRLYRTGDLARRRPDGAIEFEGRRDHLLKIRGFRVEPGEIETVLAEHPGVREAIVMVRETPEDGDKRLAAYVVLEPGEQPGATELRRFLQGRLPDYMIPAFFVPLAALPLSPNGKVDRKALPAPPEEGPPEQETLDPQSPVETIILRIWRELLGRNDVGVRDNFFDRGGHSLLVIRAHRKLSEAFPDRAIPVVKLFEHPTVESLARFLREDGAAVTENVEDEAGKLAEGRRRLSRQLAVRRGAPGEGR